MEFIEENYIWIILIGIFILMAVVGYIADKTGFISKDRIKKIGRPESPKSSEQPIIIEDKGIDELLKEAASKEVEFEKEVENNAFINEIQEENTDPFQTVQTDELILEPPVETVPTDIFADSMVSEDLTAPLMNDTVVEDNNEIDKSLFAPLETTGVNNETSIDDTATVVNEDEDIWKF